MSLTATLSKVFLYLRLIALQHLNSVNLSSYVRIMCFLYILLPSGRACFADLKVLKATMTGFKGGATQNNRKILLHLLVFNPMELKMDAVLLDL